MLMLVQGHMCTTRVYATKKEGTMRVRRGIMAAGIAIGLSGASFATAEAASAQTPTEPAVSGVITGLHTFALNAGTTSTITACAR